MNNVYLLIALNLLFCFCANTTKVLMYVPNLSYSHVNFNTKLANLLVNNEYNVTMLIVDVDPEVKHNGPEEAKVLKIDVGLGNRILPRTIWKNPGPYENASPLNPRISLKLIRVSAIFVDACKNLYTNQKLIHQLNFESYDIGFAEQYDSCAFGLFQLTNVQKTFWVSATALYRIQPDSMGVNHPLSYVPELFSPFSTQMSFLQRIQNVLIGKVTEVVMKMLATAQETELAQKTYKSLNLDSVCNNKSMLQPKVVFAKKNVKDLLQVAADSSRAVFANTSPFLDFPMPTAGFMHSVAGITIESKKNSQLNKKWNTAINNSSLGFWLVTFGSIAKTSDMPRKMQKALFHTFEQFPHITFFLKYESVEEELKQVKHNVYLARWIPQIDLLAHTKCLGILTHGGLSSILEAIHYSRPMILMPLFADHFKNAKVIERKQLGVLVDKESIHKDVFTNALRTITYSNKYSQNCRKYSQILDDHKRLVSPESLVLHEMSRAADGKPISRSKKDFQRVKKSIGWRQDYYVELLVVLVILFASICK